MWPMVEGLVERDWPVPQFHGKVVHRNYQIAQYLIQILTFIVFSGHLRDYLVYKNLHP